MQAQDGKDVLEQQMRAFIVGCHILHYHQLLDAYGHLSFRHPFNPDHFLMSRSIAPATISTPKDLIEYRVEDGEPVDPGSAKGYLERYIHSECYKRYSSVQSVIHSHSEAVIPYSISGVPLRPCLHMAGFLGAKVPVWDIGTVYRDDDAKDLLVRNVRLGASLAASLGGSTDRPSHTAALMRGHGFTVVADRIDECVLRAVYTQKNADIQTTALTTRNAWESSMPGIQYLTEEETAATTQLTGSKPSYERAWKLWEREVEVSSLYKVSM